MKGLADGLVSIVTPAFNAASFMPRTVGSVLAQTYAEFEMLIVDDRSGDETREVVRDLAAGDPRVRLFEHAENRGPAGARNTALRAGRGRYVAFLDSDDYWLETKLEEQLGMMQETGAAISYTQYRRVSQRGDLISGIVPIPPRVDYQALLKHNAMATSTVVVDRAKTGPFTMVQAYYDDYASWLDLLKRGFVAHGLKRDLARYRVVSGSWSRNKVNSARRTWEVYRHVERLPFPEASWYFVNYLWNGLKKHSA